nr:hypothetical protein [Tanacetum cinerariifolium]
GNLDNPFIAPVNIKLVESFMQTIGYQGVMYKVSAFYMKFLAQPWKTMFKVFNRCLTTRTSRHDQTKINILQLFHALVNQTNVDYAAFLWTTPRAHRTPTLTTVSPQVQEKLAEGEIEKMVKGDKDEESYAKKQDESKDDNVEKTDDVAEEKDNDNHTHAKGSMETRNE